METITAAAIIHQAAKLYIVDMVLALGLNVTDVIQETRRIYAEEAAR